MIYFDSAATSLQKPPEVAEAVAAAIGGCASPGRGSHMPAMRAADIALDCRIAAAELFGVEQPERVVFTMNATHGLNLAINTLVRRGVRVVVSGYEHNSVIRPLHARGAEIDVAASPLFEPEAAVRVFRDKLPGAGCCVCTHVSNVFGYILPIEEIARMCRYFGVPLIIDASQSAGSLRLNMSELRADFIAFPGHKGLFGPQGTGMLLCSGSVTPLLQGGTGSDSASREMPPYLPDRLEAGTHNICGIAGLLEGLRFVARTGEEKILRHERALVGLMADRLTHIPGLRVFYPNNPAVGTGVLSVIPERVDCESLAARLGESGVAVRAGLHCAPLAHMTAGTLSSGAVRFSASPFNSAEEASEICDSVEKILS